MAVAVRPLTAAEYLATPEDRPRFTELINGMIVVHEPNLPHGVAQRQLVVALTIWTRAAPGRGFVALPADITVDDHNVFAPDLWWVGEGRRPAAGDLYLDGVPDLVVEVRSPSTWARDLGTKLPAYEAAGVAEAWYVDTEAQTVLVFRRSHAGSATFDVTVELTADDDLTSPLLPGFRMTVGSILEP
ncbi:MAG: Uma2 family endonuclease [Acidimicrobiia bacterium]|nr:Uma2 family endonuclease [Acidimicrobiia bacterium]